MTWIDYNRESAKQIVNKILASKHDISILYRKEVPVIIRHIVTSVLKWTATVVHTTLGHESGRVRTAT